LPGMRPANTREIRTVNTGKPWITDAEQQDLEGAFYPLSRAAQ